MIESSEREQLRLIYAETMTFAVVGVSADVSKAAQQVPLYLQSQGYRILPVNPRGASYLESRCSVLQRSRRDRPRGHRDRGEGALVPSGDRIRGSSANSRSSRADLRHEPLYGSHSQAARPGTHASTGA